MNHTKRNKNHCLESSNNTRRDFITKSVLLSACLSLSPMVKNANDLKEPITAPNDTNIPKRKLGTLAVSAIGLGCMSMTSGHYNPPRSKDEMIPLIRSAADQGINFFDTAEYYGPFTNEALLGEALRPIRDQVVIASKFGFAFKDNKPIGKNSKPKHIRTAVEGMLKRLQTDRIDLLYLHKTDPEVPIEDVAGTVKDLIKEGKALHFGLSETSPETTRKAHQEQKVTAVQSQYSLIERVHENETLDLCQELGIGFVCWGSLNRGFLTDKFNEYSRFSENSRFAALPNFTPQAIKNNMELLRLIRRWADKKEISPAQFSLAWLLAQKPFIVPIPGTTKRHHLIENIGALQVQFTVAELKAIREEFSAIKIMGVRTPDAVYKDA